MSSALAKSVRLQHLPLRERMYPRPSSVPATTIGCRAGIENNRAPDTKGGSRAVLPTNAPTRSATDSNHQNYLRHDAFAATRPHSMVNLRERRGARCWPRAVKTPDTKQEGN